MFAPLALDDLVSNALADATAHARQRGAALTGAAEPGITVKADVRLMMRVLDSLVDNAISDTPAGAASTSLLPRVRRASCLKSRTAAAGSGRTT